MSLRRDLEAHQLAQLNAMLAALIQSNPFYAAKLRSIEPAFSNLADFSASVPFTTKRELIEDQRQHPPYGSDLTYPLSRYTRFNQTTGTTAEPLRWLDTPESWDWMLDNWKRVYGAADVTAQDRVFVAFSFGPFLGFWTAFEAATRLGCLSIPGGGMRSAARLRAMIDNGITVLCCTPTYAIRLAEVAAEEKINLGATKVRKIIVAGEAGGSITGTRNRIETLWHGAQVVDHHGMTETGPVSYGCPRRPGVLHVIEAGYITEVIDSLTGKAVGPGDRGELVLTNLGRVGSPLVRYRTGDLVQRPVSDCCECGSYEAALEGGILGRCDEMVAVRGVNIYPSAIEDIVRACDGVAEYRVEIRFERALPELSIQIEATSEHPDGASLARQLEAALRNAFSLRIPVSSVPNGMLQRFEMKAKRWIRVT